MAREMIARWFTDLGNLTNVADSMSVDYSRYEEPRRNFPSAVTTLSISVGLTARQLNPSLIFAGKIRVDSDNHDLGLC